MRLLTFCVGTQGGTTYGLVPSPLSTEGGEDAGKLSARDNLYLDLLTLALILLLEGESQVKLVTCTVVSRKRAHGRCTLL